MTIWGIPIEDLTEEENIEAIKWFMDDAIRSHEHIEEILNNPILFPEKR